MPDTADEKYDRNLYRNLQQKMNGKSEKEKTNLILDFIHLHRFVNDDIEHETIKKFILEFLIPLKSNAELDKRMLEKRWGLITECMIERVDIPRGKIAVANSQHSRKWIYQHVHFMPESTLGDTFTQFFLSLVFDDDAMNIIREEYAVEFGSTVLIELREKKLRQLSKKYKKKSPEMKKILSEAAHYRGNIDDVYNGMTEKEREQQENVEKKEISMENDGRDEKTLYADALYENLLDLELEDINEKSRKALQKCITRTRRTDLNDELWDPAHDALHWSRKRRKKIKAELVSKVEPLSEQLEALSFYRLTNSRYFNNILDDMEMLNDALREDHVAKSWPELRAALDKFQEDCIIYLNIRSGKRKFPGGRQRQHLVQNIKKMVDDAVQKIDMEDERTAEKKKAEEDKRNDPYHKMECNISEGLEKQKKNNTNLHRTYSFSEKESGKMEENNVKGHNEKDKKEIKAEGRTRSF